MSGLVEDQLQPFQERDGVVLVRTFLPDRNIKLG